MNIDSGTTFTECDNSEKVVNRMYDCCCKENLFQAKDSNQDGSCGVSQGVVVVGGVPK